MKITSSNLFKTIIARDKALDERELRLNRKSMKLSANRVMQTSKEESIDPQKIFKMGFIYGLQVARGSAMGDQKRTDGPRGFNRVLAGVADYFTADFFDFDKRGGLIGSLYQGNRRQEGGPVAKGETYLVGEKGPEYVTPTENAYVSPNEVVSSAPQMLNKKSVRTLIQPMIKTQVVTNKVVQPVPVASKSTTIKTMSPDKLPTSIATVAP